MSQGNHGKAPRVWIIILTIMLTVGLVSVLVTLPFIV